MTGNSVSTTHITTPLNDLGPLNIYAGNSGISNVPAMTTSQLTCPNGGTAPSASGNWKTFYVACTTGASVSANQGIVAITWPSWATFIPGAPVCSGITNGIAGPNANVIITGATANSITFGILGTPTASTPYGFDLNCGGFVQQN